MRLDGTLDAEPEDYPRLGSRALEPSVPDFSAPGTGRGVHTSGVTRFFRSAATRHVVAPVSRNARCEDWEDTDSEDWETINADEEERDRVSTNYVERFIWT